MADAFCILWFYLTSVKKEVQEKAARKKFEKTHAVFLKKLEDYRYKPDEEKDNERE